MIRVQPRWVWFPMSPSFDPGFPQENHTRRAAGDGESISRAKKYCQGIRGKSGQTTVAPIKAWRGSLAEPPRPLTARRDKTSPARRAMHLLKASALFHPLDVGAVAMETPWTARSLLPLWPRQPAVQAGVLGR